MKKMLLSLIESFATVYIGSILIQLKMGNGFWEIADVLMWVTIVILPFAISFDLYFKWNFYRRMIVWQYFVGMAFCLAMYCCFAYILLSPTVKLMIAAIIGTVAFGTCAFIWDWKVYNFIEFEEKGLEKTQAEVIRSTPWKKEVKLIRKLRRKFPKMSGDAIKGALYENLRFCFVDDDLENDIAVERELDPDNLATFAELDRKGADFAVKARELKEYIDVVVDNYISRRNSKEEEKKEEQ